MWTVFKSFSIVSIDCYKNGKELSSFKKVEKFFDQTVAY
jgi:hypothetical protein